MKKRPVLPPQPATSCLLSAMDSQRCDECSVAKPLTAFKPRTKDSSKGKKGEPNSKCQRCVETRNASRRTRVAKRKAEKMAADPDDLDKLPLVDLGAMSAAEFLEAVEVAKDLPINVRARVDVSELVQPDTARRERGDILAKAIGKAQDLKWT